MSQRPGRLGLTTRGSALLTAGLTAAICGVALGQRDLVRVGFLLAAAPLVASFIIGRSRLSIVCSRQAMPNRVPPTERVLMQLTLTSQSVLPTGSLMLEDQLGAPFGQRARFTLDSLRGRESRSLAYHLPAVGRGHYTIGPLTMRLVDPFGLVERTRSFRSVSDVVVFPAVEPLPPLHLPGAWDSANQASSHSIGVHGSDDASVREYRQGDDLRKVHWRSSARLGSLVVRQEERPWHGRSALLLDNRALAHRRVTGDLDPQLDPREQDSFEWAVSAAASIATHLHQRGRGLDLIAGARAFTVTGSTSLLDELAVLEPSADGDLRNGMHAVDTLGSQTSVVAVLGLLDDVSLHLLTRGKRTPGSALALLLDAGAWQVQPAGARTRQEQAIARVQLALTSAGWRVQVVGPRDNTAQAWSTLLSIAAGPGRSAPQPAAWGADLAVGERT